MGSLTNHKMNSMFDPIRVLITFAVFGDYKEKSVVKLICIELTAVVLCHSVASCSDNGKVSQ